MKKNMGSSDKVIRVLIAIAVIVLYFTKVIEGKAGIALLIVAAVFLLTSTISFCPLYTVLGISTCKNKTA